MAEYGDVDQVSLNSFITALSLLTLSCSPIRILPIAIHLIQLTALDCGIKMGVFVLNKMQRDLVRCRFDSAGHRITFQERSSRTAA